MDLRVAIVIDSPYLRWSSWQRSAGRVGRTVRLENRSRYRGLPRSVMNEKGYPNEKG